MTKQTKGPAEAATSPSHGSNPAKGLTNMDSNNTQSAQGATGHRSAKELMMDIENPLSDARNMISLMHRQLDEHFNRITAFDPDRPHLYYLSNNDVDDMIFTANMLSKFIRETYGLWQSALEADR
ncbi:hypothetical protein [Brucella intermedia]|uniref:hypothetical protein n=1 Tax=Brucella intermedia TaxID=94625 RepID=UPI00165CF141|nr:hypothetical protein [Brucella intermedia]QNQ40600.1 hypothetical protein IAR37_01835 [Brucella intermedia]